MQRKYSLIALFLCIAAFLPVFSQEAKTIHVMVALCDNKYQGIVKVPAGIGNGQDPNSNLYWGCGYGVRTYFKKSSDWKEVVRYKVDSVRLERIVFKHNVKNYYLVADAYDGRYIKQCTLDFLNSSSGVRKDSLTVDGKKIGIFGNSEVLAYVGHNGLMDFKLTGSIRNVDGVTRQVMIFACASRQYFRKFIEESGANPLVWSTHLMAAEAYPLHAALKTYLEDGDDEAVSTSAAAAYAKYQKCSLKAAKRLLVTGF